MTVNTKMMQKEVTVFIKNTQLFETEGQCLSVSHILYGVRNIEEEKFALTEKSSEKK